MILSNLRVHKEQNPMESIYFDPKNSTELVYAIKKVNEIYDGSPNFLLEENSKFNLESRTELFGKKYIDIVKNTFYENK